jgi:hypothetical protein
MNEDRILLFATFMHKWIGCFQLLLPQNLFLSLPCWQWNIKGGLSGRGAPLLPWQVAGRPLASSPQGQGEGRRKGGGRGGGGLEEGVHGLDPCTTPSLGYPPKLLLKLDHFSIFFGDFSFFLWNFFVYKTKMEIFRFTIGIFILWKIEDA